jgi:D-sedoheptulose 7-phosphate isomerase
MNRFHEVIQTAIKIQQSLAQDPSIEQKAQAAVDAMVMSLKHGGRILFCGNGGSAADAQHLAAEFSGRFYFDRAPLDAEALHVNTSFLTAVANDYHYDEIYARLIKAKGRSGDTLVGISTSGNSKNILNAFRVAKGMGITLIAMTGESGGQLAAECDILLNVPSKDTPRIQEAHILLGHYMAECVETMMFSKSC